MKYESGRNFHSKADSKLASFIKSKSFGKKIEVFCQNFYSIQSESRTSLKARSLIIEK